MDEKKEERSGDQIQVNISGPVGGQVAAGRGITQTQIVGASAVLTEAELRSLQQLLTAVKTRVEAEAPPEQKAAALERVQELEEAVTGPQLDLTTMEYVKGWFAKHLPALAGAVTSIVVHPIVGKLVEAAGDALSAEFRRRFSTDKTP